MDKVRDIPFQVVYSLNGTALFLCIMSLWILYKLTPGLTYIAASTSTWIGRATVLALFVIFILLFRGQAFKLIKIEYAVIVEKMPDTSPIQEYSIKTVPK